MVKMKRKITSMITVTLRVWDEYTSQTYTNRKEELFHYVEDSYQYCKLEDRIASRKERWQSLIMPMAGS